jgi:DNA excision repair protein ERCC-2
MDWRAVFGHPEPYEEQADGAETVVETAREGGFTVVEGACGTGKTMLALSAGISLVRDPDTDYERVLALTSVKQQLRQFEADLRTINADLPDEAPPVSGLTLVGKADVCPYNRVGAGGIDDENVYDRCEALRDRTRALTEETTAGALAAEARSQQVGIGGDAAYLDVDGEPSPYPPEMPESGDTEFCPFYAGFLDDLPEDGDPAEAVPFDVTERGLVEPDELVRLGAEHGSCPHSVMGALLGSVEVVLGNYYHAFDPTTVASFTGALLDPSTFVVCDEAHMLEPRVRELVSDGVGDRTLRDAETELSRVIEPLQYEGRDARGDDADLIRGELADADVTLDDLEAVRAFLGDLRSELDRRVTAHLDREAPGWRSSLADLDDQEIPLRDPETPETDAITEWAEREGYHEEWVLAEAVGAVVARILNAAEEEERSRAAPAAGRVLAAWKRVDHERYFRAVDLDRTWDDTESGWRRAYNASLSLHNCLPGAAIGDRLDEFGGGVLMSATLEPLPAFARVTGLDDIDRPVVERRYGLSFPEQNRASYAVAAPKFTYENRGPPDEDSEARRAHARAVREVAGVPGNVLVGMPSYAEAEWAAGVLAAVDKPVLVDESGGADATERLKEEFFAGDGKVLVTSLRGTLTEGVDYRGDRLSAAVVCGVPLVNTASPKTRAVRTAYDRAFGDGFRYALTIPAVRKARQALGRVIRGPREQGVRVLVDERYARDSWDSVRDLVPEEYRPVSPDMLSTGLDRFFERPD